MNKHEALYYETRPNGIVLCKLCPHNCSIGNGKTGVCGVRKNEKGKLYSLNYGKVSSLALDPIEKKPLYRFFPGSTVLSAGGFGCNFKCTFCQNWSISQKIPSCREITPHELAGLAAELKFRGNIGAAFTYNEPTIWYEYVYDCAKLIKEQDQKIVLVTNGYISPDPIAELLPYIDAMNIDLKSMSDGFYKGFCKGSIAPVLETICACAKACHVEITTLIIPGKNDSEDEIGKLSQWVASISREIPLHLTRYHPDYMMSQPPETQRETVLRLAQIARKHIKYVYCGNM